MECRQAKISDVAEIAELEKRAWPEGGAATNEQISSRINIFPEGVIVAVIDNKIVGTVMGELIDFEEIMNSNGKTWAGITGNGYITTHKENGDVLFGVDLSVDPTVRNKGIGRRLLLEIGKMAVRYNLRGGILGARMPEYHKYKSEYTAEQYLSAKNENGELLDSELRFYQKSGLKLVKVMPGYFPDEESLDYGVLAYWKNPFRLKNAVAGKVFGTIMSQFFKI